MGGDRGSSRYPTELWVLEIGRSKRPALGALFRRSPVAAGLRKTAAVMTANGGEEPSSGWTCLRRAQSTIGRTHARGECIQDLKGSCADGASERKKEWANPLLVVMLRAACLAERARSGSASQASPPPMPRPIASASGRCHQSRASIFQAAGYSAGSYCGR
jgi:hypothetical protein